MHFFSYISIDYLSSPAVLLAATAIHSLYVALKDAEILNEILLIILIQYNIILWTYNIDYDNEVQSIQW